MEIDTQGVQSYYYTDLTDCASNCIAGDIDDVVYLISFVFSGGNPPCDTNGDTVPNC